MSDDLIAGYRALQIGDSTTAISNLADPLANGTDAEKDAAATGTILAKLALRDWNGASVVTSTTDNICEAKLAEAKGNFIRWFKEKPTSDALETYKAEFKTAWDGMVGDDVDTVADIINDAVSSLTNDLTEASLYTDFLGGQFTDQNQVPVLGDKILPFTEELWLEFLPVLIKVKGTSSLMDSFKAAIVKAQTVEVPEIMADLRMWEGVIKAADTQYPEACQAFYQAYSLGVQDLTSLIYLMEATRVQLDKADLDSTTIKESDKKALKAFYRSISDDEDEAIKDLLRRGDTLEKGEFLPEALDLYHQVLSIQPTNSEAKRRAGNVYRLTSLPSLAAGISPEGALDNNSSVSRERAVANFRAGDYEKAAEDFQALYLKGGDPLDLFNSALSSHFQADYTKAVEMYLSFLAERANDFIALMCYRRARKHSPPGAF